MISRREFVFGRLDEGAEPMKIWREAETRFGHCGWNYITKLKREHATLARELQVALNTPEGLSEGPPSSEAASTSNPPPEITP